MEGSFHTIDSDRSPSVRPHEVLDDRQVSGQGGQAFGPFVEVSQMIG
jgi:hypothetical protein